MKQTIRLTESNLKGLIREAIARNLNRPRRNRARLAESKLRGMINEAVRAALNEGGNLFIQNDDGSITTNAKETYRGVKGSVFIDHGDWSDADIYWKGELLNVNKVEDGLWFEYERECRKKGNEATEDDFERWLEERGPSYIASHLDDCLYDLYGD